MASLELLADRFDIEEHCLKERQASWNCNRTKGAASCEPETHTLNKCAHRFGHELERLNKQCAPQISSFQKCRAGDSTSECRKEASAVFDCYNASGKKH